MDVKEHCYQVFYTILLLVLLSLLFSLTNLFTAIILHSATGPTDIIITIIVSLLQD